MPGGPWWDPDNTGQPPGSPGNPYPWERGSAQAAPAEDTPPDTTLRDQQLQALIAKHGAVIGQPNAMLHTRTAAELAAAKAADPKDTATTQKTGYDQYTFADGSSIEFQPDGQSQNYKQSTEYNQSQSAARTSANRAPTSLEEQQKVLGSITIPGYGTYTQDPSSPTGYSLSSQSQQSLALNNQKTQADITYTNAQARAAELKAAVDANPNNQAAINAKNQADAELARAQAAKSAIDAQAATSNAASTAMNAASTAARVGSQNALDIAQAGAAGSNAATNALNAQSTAARVGSQNALEQAQAQNQLAAAQAATRKMYEPTLMQTGTGPTYTYWDPTQQQMVTAPNTGYVPTDPGRMAVQLNQQIQQQHDLLNQQVLQGKLSPDAAGSQMQSWWEQNVEPIKGDIAEAQAKAQAAIQYQQAQTQNLADTAAYNRASLANTASENAQKNMMSLLPYMSGTGFNQAMQQVNAGGKLTPEQIVQASTFSMPNLQEVGRQGAAAALANFSPTAQAHLNTPGPPIQNMPMPGMGGINSMINMGNYNQFGAPAGGAGGVGAGIGAPPPAPPAAPQPAAGGGNINLGGFNGAMPTANAQPDWYTALLQRQSQDAALQGQQAGIWGQYQPGGG